MAMTVSYVSVRVGSILCRAGSRLPHLHTVGLCCADSASLTVTGTMVELCGRGATGLCFAGCRRMRGRAPFGGDTWSPPYSFPSLGVFTKLVSSVILFM